jgi:putative membrane protein
VGEKDLKLWERIIKGFIIGASMLVPGVSGGTMAIILGVYNEMIHAVSTLKQKFKENGLLLIIYGISALVGILFFAKPMLAAVTLWNKPMMYLFMGAIIASIPPLYRRVRVARIRPVNMLVAVFGAALGVCIKFLPEGLFIPSQALSIGGVLLLLVAGVIIAIALVLPGISASYILLMMGMYDLTLLALQQLDLPYLIPLVIGILSGTYFTAGVLERQMERHPQFTYMLIIGFMIGSLVEVFPGMPEGIESIYCLLTFIIGLGVILWIGRRRV